MNSKLKDERELLSKPGDTITETLEHLRMSQVELAERMGKTPSKVNDIISSKEPISVNTALQLEKVLGIDAQFWLNREIIYRESLSRLEQKEVLEECIDWLKTQPIKELKKYGYIKSEKIGPAMADECLKFYGVAAPINWESLYVEHYASSDFRKSEAHKDTLSSMAAWLRVGEIEMRKRELVPFDKDFFKLSLTGEIKNIIREHPEDFATLLQELCAKSGVAVVYTMCIPKAPISGAARWFGGNPLIQLSDRYKSNDQFWFTFYHEAGHILLHGKKDVFLEGFEGHTSNLEKERAADEFAIKWLLPENVMSEFSGEITEKDIQIVARKYKTHPAIILSRLQHPKVLPYSFGNSIKVKVLLNDIIGK